MDLYNQCSYTDVLFKEQFEVTLGVLQRHSVSTVEILTHPVADIAKRTGLTTADILRVREQLRKDIAERTSIGPVADHEEFFTTGDETLDVTLGGNGISLGHLTEVSGESAVGKSQLMMQLAVTVQLPREMNGLGMSLTDETINSKNDAQVVYISTEKMLETRRLDHICKHFIEVLKENGVDNSAAFPSTDNILQQMCSDLASQQHILEVQLPVLLEQKKGRVKLVIVDSIAHHIRAEIDTSKSFVDYLERQCLIVKLARNLKSLASEYNFACVVTNQVSDKPFDAGLIKSSNNNFPFQFEYQLGWLSGWDYKAIKRRQDGDTVEVDAETLVVAPADTEESLDAQLNVAGEASIEEEKPVAGLTLTERLKLESKNELFQDQDYFYDYKIPTMGIQWTNQLDVRIALSKKHTPIIGSNLIDDYAEDLGITSDQSQSTQDKSLTEILSSHEYLNNYNWEIVRQLRLVFSLFVRTGTERECHYEVWNGGVRSKH